MNHDAFVRVADTVGLAIEGLGVLLIEIVGSTRGLPEDLVAALLTLAGRAELRHRLQPGHS